MAGREHVIYVLVVVQAAAGLLAMLGELLFMGHAGYLVMPVLHAGLLVLLAAKAARRRRWAFISLIVGEGMSLVGVGLSLLVGLLAPVDRTVTLTGLLTELALPITVIVYCAQSLAGVGGTPAKANPAPAGVAVAPSYAPAGRPWHAPAWYPLAWHPAAWPSDAPAGRPR